MKKQLIFTPALSALLLGTMAQSARSFERSDDTIAFHGPDVHSGYPDAFQFHYLLPKDTVSPDGKYGLIFPDRQLGGDTDSVKDYVVALKPAQILGLIDGGDFEGKSNGGYEVEWSKDSSVALVTFESKWGPGGFFVLEFQDGKISRLTDLDRKIRSVFEPEFRKSKAEPYNDTLDFIYETQESEAPFCKLSGTTQVRIDALVTSDPKQSDSWQARLRAIWDIRNAKFTEQRLTRVRNR
jgi:hypothetical protein